MRRRFLFLGSLLAAATVALAGGAAYAHGGVYVPPPEGGGPGSPPPPGGGPTTPGGGSPGGPTTPGGDVGGGPRTPGGGDVGGPTTPGGGDGPRGPSTGSGPGKAPGNGPGGSTGGPITPPGGPVTGPVTPGGTGGGVTPPTGGSIPQPPRGRSAQGLAPDHWTRWWYANRFGLLDLDTRVAANAANTPGGQVSDDALWRAQTQSVLLAALGDRDEDVASAAAIALGKDADAASVPALTRLLLDRQRQQPVREAAALGLALAGTSSHPSSSTATTALEEIASRSAENDRLRATCVWALGLRRDAAAVPFLLDIATAKASSWDVPAAAVSALGLAGNDAAREPLLAWLDGTPGRRRHETMRRVHACHALAHLGDRTVVPALRDVLRDDDEDVRRASVLALGVLADRDDEETSLLLVRLLDRDRDRGVRNMAALSLGRIGSRAAERALRYAYAKSDSLTQPFAALGIGLFVRGTGADGMTSALRNDFRDRANADLRGALAIALGLARDKSAAKVLRDVLADRGDPELRAHAAFALGLLGDETAAESLRTTISDARDPVLQREASMALGLLGDVRAIPLLTRLVGNGSSLYVQGAAAMALGRIGGGDAAKTLTALVQDTSRPGLARGFAVVGLGHLLDRSSGRGLAKIGTHLDWYVPTPSVQEILTIL